MKWWSVYLLLFLFNGAFAQSNVLIAKLYNSERFSTTDFDAAMAEAGFKNAYLDSVPNASDLDSALMKADQLWIISDWQQHLDSSHLEVIQSFLMKGKSMYILADNEPYDADADFVSNYFTGSTFDGNYMADKRAESLPGCDLNIDANKEKLYEGFTVSAISLTEATKPQYTGSDGQVFIASFDNANYRILLDGGFTRLYNKWTPRSAEYFVRAAKWLSHQ